MIGKTKLAMSLSVSVAVLAAAALAACDGTLPTSGAGASTAQQNVSLASPLISPIGAAQTLAAQVGHGVVRLKDGPDAGRAIMARLLDAGVLAATTANASVSVHTAGQPRRLDPVKPRQGQTQEQAEEMRREYEQITAGGYVDGPVDLRFDFDHWQYAFAVTAQAPDGQPHNSLRFFDAQGDEVHRVDLSPQGAPVFAQIVDGFKASGTAATATRLELKPPEPAKADQPDSAIDVAAYRKAWQGITDVHQFYGIQEKYQLGREQALRLAPADAVQQLDAGVAVRTLLELAVRDTVPIMAFVSNQGLTHIYADVPQAVRQEGEWLVLSGPGENSVRIHVTDVATGWLARRGRVTSVDFFDRQGRPLVTFFGKRIGKEYQITEKWPALVAALPRK